MAQPPFEAQRDGFLLSTDPDRLDIDLIHDFLSNRSYWAKGVPREVIEKSIAHSICFGIYTENQQVGFARVVSDTATFAWIADVFILEDYRGRGLAKWLLQSILSYSELQGLRRWCLATRDAHGLYARYGFIPLRIPERWMEKQGPEISNKPPSA